MIKLRDTIVGIATAVAPSGIGIIRMSGDNALKISEEVFVASDKMPLTKHPARELVYGTIHNASGDQPLDKCLAVLFRAPHSYTGEDVVEFHCHGNPLLLRKVMAALCHRGARAAEPGEFTKRAFLNGRMDLTQAEAVAALVNAMTERAHQAALRNLEGALSQDIRNIRDKLLDLLAALEVVIDYADEDLPEVPFEEIQQRIGEAINRLDTLEKTYQEGRILREGATVAIAGKPNVGKSSLLNALAKEDRAIVSPIPGTTRDYVEAWVRIGGLPVRFVDTAGLRETDDPIEELGTERTQSVLRSADLVLFVVDGSQPLTPEDAQAYALVKRFPHLLVVNKNDLPRVIDLRQLCEEPAQYIGVSALTGQGIQTLSEAVETRLLGGASLTGEGAVLMEARHRDLIEESIGSLREAQSALANTLPLDLVNVGIRGAVSALSRLTGDDVTEDLLDRIFANFCVGK